ncbi:hypothetical protein RB595_010294 [Gaeumannomyces hyphopodioides]
MSIFNDAREGTLVGAKLKSYLKSKPKILNEVDPETGLTPLGIAVVEGFPDEVEELLKNGAEVDHLPGANATPLLLAAWKTVRERPLIIQRLLEKTDPKSIDRTIKDTGNKTPFMLVIEKEDIDCIRMLRSKGASLTIKNDDGFTAGEMAEHAKDPAVTRAALLDEKNVLDVLAKLASRVISVLLYIITFLRNLVWRTEGKTVRPERLPAQVVINTEDPNDQYNKLHQQVIGDSEEPSTPEEFLGKVDNFLQKCGVVPRFFKDKDFVQNMARKAAALEDDPDTDLGKPGVLAKTIKVTMHQQVFYCDDSSSTKHERRWELQRELVKRIARITTRILPEGEGVALRFINQDVSDNSSNLTLEELCKTIDSTNWKKGGRTEIGTYLRSKILEPMVYRKLQQNTFGRPLLVSVVTDGNPDPEDRDTLAKTIAECGSKLVAAGCPRDSVKFVIGQVGTSKKAADFLETLRANAEIEPMTFVISDKLDAKLAEFHKNERELDRWLIETLFAPISKSEIWNDPGVPSNPEGRPDSEAELEDEPDSEADEEGPD